MNNKLAAFKQPQSMAAFTNVPRQTEIMGQPHMLSYINPQEEAMLQKMRGGMPPVAGPGGVPSYFIFGGETGFGSWGDSIADSWSSDSGNDNNNNTVTVSSGNTLSQIAEDNNMSVAEIMADNPDITDPDQIQVGQTLDLSGAGSGSATYAGGVGAGGIGSGSDDDPVVTNTPTFTSGGLEVRSLDSGTQYYVDEGGEFVGLVPKGNVPTYTDTSSISGISNASGNLGVENDAGTTLLI